MKDFIAIMIISGCIIIPAFMTAGTRDESRMVPLTLAFIKDHAESFAASAVQLEQQSALIDPEKPQSIIDAKDGLRKCRLEYKSMEFFLQYFLKSVSDVYNNAPKYEVEEPFMEYKEPSGLQVIEALLFSQDPASRKKELTDQANLVSNSAADIKTLLFNLPVNDKQILESIRIELIRVIALNITGYDAPELKSGIEESARVLESMKTILHPLLTVNGGEADSVLSYLNTGLELLNGAKDFNSFNRMEFLMNSALPLQHHLNLFIKENGFQLNTTGVINYDAKNIFNRNAINLFAASASDSLLVPLGEKLFFEKDLSGNNMRSCASCHQPEHYFTDSLPKSLAMDGKGSVLRNAPSMFYTGDQYAQFWDARAKSFDEQILSVLGNPIEMGGDHTIIVNRLSGKQEYVRSFEKAFPGDKKNPVNIQNLSLAITAFLKTLSPMTSPFDRYINGDNKALNKNQVHGFNLFMGKAQCGTCHFAPIFNGLIPPLYDKTELEVLGTPANADFEHPIPDKDSGRFASFPIIYYNGAFKTPTVRNAAKTAPYMHNGAFASLEKVIDFYNKGGGIGIGLKVPEQTLSPKALNLDSAEIKDIISFLQSLTDTCKACIPN